MNRFFLPELELCDVQASYLSEDDFSDSDSDAVDSDVEFHLYSQIHYSSSYHDADIQESAALSPNAEISSVTPEYDVTDSESDEDCDVIDGDIELSDIKNEQNDKVGPFKRADIALLKDHLDQDEEEFVPESWEIIDSVEDDDEMVDIHIHDSGETMCGDEDSDEGSLSTGPECWQIDEKDRKRFKHDTKGRYYSDTPNSRQRCRNCNDVGHLARDCPEAKKQPACFTCGGRGHRGKECPERQNLQYTRRNVECNRCGQEGHIKRECPDIWRQFHAVTKVGKIEIPDLPVKTNENVWCYNCGSKGHFGEECEEEQSCYYPIQSAFVYEYDEYARTYPARSDKTKNERLNDKSFSSSTERKSQPRQKRQHFAYESSSSDAVDYENYRDRNEYSNYNRTRNKQEISGRYDKNEQRNSKFNQTKHDKYRTRNENSFYEEKRHFNNSDFDRPRKTAKKRPRSPEIIYHNTRKVVFSDSDSSPVKRKNHEFKEPFPRSKKPRNRDTVQKFEKKRRHDDRNRKLTNRGFRGRYK